MAFPIDEIVVIDIAGDSARVHAASRVHRGELKRIGFIERDGDLVKTLRSADDRIAVLAALIELGGLFADGRDWSPAELAQYYREQGFIRGSYRVIAWQNPEQFQISIR